MPAMPCRAEAASPSRPRTSSWTGPGRATSFTIYMPRVAPAQDSPTVISEITPNRGSEAILVVDDEEAIRSLVSQILQRDGYSVVEAKDGLAAMALMEQGRFAIDAVITDMIMPNLSGRELAA